MPGLMLSYNGFIMKTSRDEQIVRLVGQFQQLTTDQIQQLLFAEVTDTPVYRALERLCKARYLVKVGRKLIHGVSGGSAPYVYSLGPVGWQHLYTGRYRLKRSVPYPHLLDVADAHVALVKAERAGRIQIAKVKVESAASVTVGGQLLRPDLFVRYKSGSKKFSLWIECDRATEHRGQMAAMLDRYRQALLNFDGEVDPFPYIVVLVRTDLVPVRERVNELRRLVSKMPEERARALFRIDTLDSFPQDYLL